MVYCRYCGTALPDDSVFCYKCGKAPFGEKTENIAQEPEMKTQESEAKPEEPEKERQEPAKTHRLVIRLRKDEQNEKPKVFLDGQMVGMISADSDFTVYVAPGKHTVHLKGAAGSGRKEEISIGTLNDETICFFRTNPMSQWDRYSLENTSASGSKPIFKDAEGESTQYRNIEKVFNLAHQEENILGEEEGAIVYLVKPLDPNYPLSVGKKYEIIKKAHMVDGEMVVTVKGPLVENYPQVAKQITAKAGMFSSEYPQEAVAQAKAEYDEANRKVTKYAVGIGVVIGVIVLLFMLFMNKGPTELSGKYVSDEGHYINFTLGWMYSKDGTQQDITLRIGWENRGTGNYWGTYELKGSKLILHINDGENYYKITCTYDKNTDTITGDSFITNNRVYKKAS